MCLPYIYIVRYCQRYCIENKFTEQLGDRNDPDCKKCKITWVSLIEGDTNDKRF